MAPNARLRTLRRFLGGLATAASLALALAPASPAAAPFGPTSLAEPFAESGSLAAAAALPAEFEESIAWSGLTNPTAIRFAPDGRVFIAQKNGQIKVFDGLADQTATIYADLRTQVHDFWDRGLLGMALDPSFATRPYVYVLYTYDKDPSSPIVPRWGDACPNPPGATGDGCVVSGRLSRVDSTGSEQVLIEDWCQQYPSHSIGSLAFGSDGALYASAGDGASFTFADWGQDGSPVNPCGDPPGGRGATLAPPTAEGGSLRSQDIRSSADPTGLDGTILRLDPDTGAAMTGNPNAGSPDPNARRIVATGFRNPFRITIRPGTNEVWAGDVGWGTWEEIDRVVNPTAPMRNYGWPCYEGAGRMSSYDSADLSLCETLYSQGTGAHNAPYYTYNHGSRVVAGESCPTGGSSVAGLAFYNHSAFPARYRNALFFADYSRRCIWAMLPGADGLPDPARIETFVSDAAGPVDLQVGPAGDLFYADLNGGTIRRIRYLSANLAPTAQISATPTEGVTPLDVSFDGTGSSDPDGDPLTYAWDLDGDGAFDDSSASRPTFRYTTAGVYTVQLRVTDPSGLSGVANVTITAGNPPTATISTPAAGTTWRVGDTISFSGSATDFQGTPIPASGLSWDLKLQHCERVTGSCHTHPVQTFAGVASGSFTTPDHDFPSHLELSLTATDSRGLRSTVTRRLDPRTVRLTMDTAPAGLQLSFGPETLAAPFTREVIIGSANTLTAPSPQTSDGSGWEFASWSDGGARSHTVVAPATDTTYRATFNAAPVRLAGADVVGSNVSAASPGTAEVYRTTATTSGRATRIRLRLASDSSASAVVLGLYADSSGNPAGLLASGRISSPAAGTWTELTLANGPQLTAGQAYWIALLNPRDATGTLRWHDRAGGSGGAEQTSASGTLTTLPGTWARGGSYSDGPVSAYVMGNPDGPPPPATLAVTPSSLSFSATQGGPSPAAQSLNVSNGGSGALSFTASDDAAWLGVTPTSGTAPRSLSVSVNSAGLAQGTYSATVRVESSGAQGSPKLIPVTLTVGPPAPAPVLAVSPASLSFSGVAGGANPAAQTLSVSNQGGGSLSFTASDDQTWLAVSPGSGTAPQNLSVSTNTAGLSAGTYNGTVRVEAPGVSGSPKTVPVTLTLSQPPPPASGLVGAWSFNEASGATAVDASGRGNPGTISGATRVAGRYGGGLSFDGTNDWVTIADSASLDLTSGMTLEAWVRPTALGTTWRTVAIKERPGELAYALYANTDTTRPSGHVFTNAEYGLRGPSALPTGTWTHLATTWDGTTLRLYVGGTQVASALVTGTLATSANAFRIGGNAVWPEWFAGVIDEVRAYNRALSAAEVQQDANAPIAAQGGALSAARRTPTGKPLPRHATRERAAGRSAARGARQKALRIRRTGRIGPRTADSVSRLHRPRWLRSR